MHRAKLSLSTGENLLTLKLLFTRYHAKKGFVPVGKYSII